MKTFPLVISSPDGDIFSDEITKISLRGAEGDLAIMAGHIPFVTPVVPCDCSIELENGDSLSGYTDGGILTVSTDKVTLLLGSFQFK